MANQDVRVSALQSASTLSTEDLALATVVDELSETGYTSKKITEGAKASQYMEAFTFANLNTSAKTIVGAINEAATTGGSDEFVIHMTDTTVTETAADIIDAFDNGSEIWLESQMTGEALKTRLPLLAYISDSNSLVLRFSGITYSNNRYRYCDVQMTRSPEQILGKQAVNVTFAVIDDTTTSASSVWSSQKTAGELEGKAEIDDTAIDTETAWSSSRIVSLLPTESASGAVASFETPLTLPLVSHNVTIEPAQAGTGDPSPSNVRPISGWNAVNVTRTGKNLLDPQLLIGYWDASTGEFVSDSTWRASKKIKCKPNTTYVMSGTTYSTGGYSGRSLFWDASGNYLGYRGTGANFTSYPNSAYMAIYTGASYITNQMQIEEGSTSTTYEAYNGNTYEIDLDGTVYGGELDVTNGVLTIANRKVKPTTQSNISGSLHTANNVWAFTLSEEQAIYAALVPILSNINNSMGYTVATVSGFCMALAAGKPIFALADSDSGLDANSNTTQILNAFHTFVEMYSPEAVYPLATPVEITLTPEQINTLKGVNNIWADTGDTAVEYKQDIQTYIDNRLSSGTRSLSLAKAPVETKEETKQEEQEGDEDVDR